MNREFYQRGSKRLEAYNILPSSSNYGVIQEYLRTLLASNPQWKEGHKIMS